MKSSVRFFINLLCAVLLLAGGVPFLHPMSIAHAAPPRIFFSEYVEGPGNDNALEIFNGTGSAIDLAAGGYHIDFYLDGSTTPGTIINLTGTVANGDVYVVADAEAVPALLSRADQTYRGAWFDGNDAVVLSKGRARLDVIGQIGFDPGSAWTDFGASTAGSTLRRPESYCAGDPSGSDAFHIVGRWQEATDRFGGLGTHSANCPSLGIPEPLLYGILAAVLLAIAIALTWITRRKGIKLGMLGTFVRWLAAYILLLPIAEFIAARGDARTLALAAMAEFAIIALAAGILVGWTQRDRMQGALQWLGVLILTYVPIAISFSDVGAGLRDLSGFSEWAAVGLSLALYQVAFFVTHYLRQRRSQ